LGVMGVRVGVANFFWGQSRGIDETNTFQLKLKIKVGVASSRNKLALRARLRNLLLSIFYSF